MQRSQATALLAQLGLSSGPLERAYGNSNAVWMSSTHVVRGHALGPPGRLAHEALVAERLGPQALYPTIVSVGWRAGHDWMVQERTPGCPLCDVWPELTLAERQRAIAELGRALRVIHGTKAEGLSPPCQFGGVPVIPRVATARWAAGVFESRAGSSALFREAARRASRLAASLDDDPDATIHGDLNLTNVLWNDGVVAVLDLEMARREAPDVDLFGLLSFCADPVRAVAEDLEARTDPRDYEEIPVWLRSVYPELFAHPALSERLRLYELIALAVGLRHAVAGERAHAEKKLATVLGGHGDVDRFGL
jgi:aminoglycoside phosphotransferase (APT) family kinase protein